METKSRLIFNNKEFIYYDINKVGKNIDKLPYSVRVLLESLLRKADGKIYTDDYIDTILDYKNSIGKKDIPFLPARVILQDFTGVPAILDLTAMKEALKEDNKSDLIKPSIPVELVIDHSLQVDNYKDEKSLNDNIKREFERNKERYEFLNWAENSIAGVRIIPPSNGIIHQINLEYLARVVMKDEVDGETILYPDTVFGTDSHTTMVNALGVIGWGVGGIEAEAAMLNQPSYIVIPKVMGVRLENSLKEGVTATDLALTITKILRDKGVVGDFVEFFGEGYSSLSLSDRATIANMAPEYGATTGFFPVDNETLSYLLLTGRDEEEVSLIKEYLVTNKMFYEEDNNIEYTDVIEVDLSCIKPSISGPKRPQDLTPLSEVKDNFLKAFPVENKEKSKVILKNGEEVIIEEGSIVIAAITSCTNTSNPSVMIAAGLLAKKAYEMGLKIPGYVKSSLTPGSKVVKEYLDNSGLTKYLNKMGFYINGYGCATCIGNSGPIDENLEKSIKENNYIVSSVLSGNRNFEGRIHQSVKANYLASPPLVIAYAIAGNIKIDLYSEPISVVDGKEIYLKDIWPSSKEISEVLNSFVTPEIFKKVYGNIGKDNGEWDNTSTSKKDEFEFRENSTYIRKPPFFENEFNNASEAILENMRVLAKFDELVTTDHISPAGNIREDLPAAKYLLSKGVSKEEFNTYGSRRGNHEVMMRGTFANIRIKNSFMNGAEGGNTIFWPENKEMSIFEASEKYKEINTEVIILAGKDYGMGSSRDWAAKGPYLLGVKAVIAESYERIHRSNLVMMGILPLQYMDGENADTLNLKGDEVYSIKTEDIFNNKYIKVEVRKDDIVIKEFEVRVRFDSEVEKEYYKNNGILNMVINKIKNK